MFPPIFMAAALLAQTPQKAPPEVDAALRARISQFYQLEVDGKFSQALPLVADDTKDMFVGTSKPTYRSFEIQSVMYDDDFKKAEVVVLVTRLMPVEGFLGHPIKTKVPSHWKLENGQWCWYVDPQKDLPASPFGPVRPPGAPAPTATAAPPGAAPQGLPAIPVNTPSPSNFGALTVNKLSVKLKSTGPSAEQVVIHNPSPWTLTLSLAAPRIAGLTAKLDHAVVSPSKDAMLSIQSSGGGPKLPITVLVTVAKTNQVIPIKVFFEQ
jgi:hypothetical protein